MDATQMISDSILESEDEETAEVNENNRGPPVAKLCILKNQHIPEAELPLFMGENVLGRDPNTCTQVFAAPSVSKQHASISISVYGGRGSRRDVEVLLWDLGSMNGTRKGHRKLTPNVRYALSEGDSLVVADIPCQYVSSAVDIFSQGDLRTRPSKTSGVNARVSDTSGRNGDDISTDSKTCVSGGTKAGEPDLENARKTPQKTGCLSFEQTPTQPQGILVPESDLDSDGEIQKVERKRKALISDTDSSISSPATKIVPESEDESPITPSVSAKNRPTRHVSFSKEESDSDVGRQQLKEKKALTIVDDSEEEEGGEEERTTLGGRKSEDSGQHVTVQQGNNASFTGEEELPVSAPAVVTDGIPAFNMDSDTDVEGEEEVAGPVGAATLNTNEQAAQPPDTARFHMDSDTDVDEDDNASERASKSVPSSSAAGIKPSHVIPVIQPEGITMDSDTDVEGEEEVVVPVTLNSNEQTARPPNTAQFHMDSDTDVDEDDEALAKVPKSVPSSAADTKPSHATPAIQPEAPTVDSDTDVDEDTAVSDAADPAPLLKPAHFHLDSDTDVEEEEKEAINTSCKTDETPSRSDNKQNEPSSDPAPHDLHLDSDTEDETVAVPAISGPSTVPPVTESNTAAEGAPDLDILSDSDTETEDNCPVVKPHAITDLSVTPDTASKAPHSESDADTDVDESSTPPAGDRVNAADPPLDSDVNVEGKEVDLGLANEDQIPHLCRESTPGLLVPPLQKCSTPVQLSERGVEDMDTQAFLSPSGPFRCTRSPALKPKASFSLSDSLEDEDCVVAETQSFVLQTRDHTMDATQAFTTDSSGDEKGERSSRGASFQLGLSDSSHLQAQAQAVAMESTQAFVSVGGSENLEDAETDPNLEATQAYGEGLEMSTSSATAEKEGQVDLALAATQAYISESCEDSEDETNEDKTRDISTAETQPLDFPISSTVAMAETQLMSALDEEDEESSEERKEHGEAAQAPEKPLREALSMAETQPLHMSHDEGSNDEDSFPGPRKRKAKRLHLEDEQTQPLVDSELSSVETQPMLDAHGESQDEDLIPGPRKRRGRAQQHEEDQTQPMASSEVSVAETQPMHPLEDGESDDEDSVPGPRKRRAKAPRIQEEETQSLTNSERETQDLDTKAEAQLQRGRRQQPEAGTSGDPGKRRTRTRLREEEEQAESSEPPRRQTRGRNKALPITRGRRGKSIPGEEESEEEEEMAMGKRARGKQTTRQKKKAEEEETFERNQRTAKRNRQVNEEDEGRCGGESNDLELKQDEEEKKEERGKDRAERIRKEKEQAEKGRKEKEEKDRLEREEKDRLEREEKERLEREEKERMEGERLEREEKERMEREEKERLEGERLEREEKERMEREETGRMEREEKERLEREEKERRERLEREEKERLEREEKERKEKEEKLKIEKERKEQEDKETARKRELEERLEMERTERERQARLETEAKEREERERLEREKQEEEENTPKKAPVRGRRAARRTNASPSTTALERDSASLTNEDVPARRTRSRSNSSNSISSERSVSSVNTPESKGRGRGRGRGSNRTSDAPQAVASRGGSRRKTATAEPEKQDSNENSPQAALSRSNSNNSLNSEFSSCNSSSQGRGRGGRQQGRGRKSESSCLPPSNSQSDSSSTKSAPRGRKSRIAEETFNDDDEKETGTTRGQRQATADEEGPSHQREGSAVNESPLPKKTARGRGQKVAKNETTETTEDSDRNEAAEKRKGRKRELEENSVRGEAVAAEATGQETTAEIPPVQTKRGRTSNAQVKKNPNVSSTKVVEKEEDKKIEEAAVERRGKGRPSAVPRKRKEQEEEMKASAEQDTRAEASEPKTPTSVASRKRQAPSDSSPLAKSRRASSGPPAASGLVRAVGQTYKVLFTGVVDEAGERVLARLGGSMAKGVADMNCLVTDKVRRTVKFLCALAKGVPIVTTQWLEKSGKAGSLLSTDAFIVKDPEQEQKFNFCLQESLKTASSHSLLQGYAIHVTKSVKPEPVQMKDIISCSGATFLAKMPTSQKPQTVVISCEDDWPLCGPALSASLPVVTAEFILTGILQQKLDFQTYALTAPAAAPALVGGRGRGRKKT